MGVLGSIPSLPLVLVAFVVLITCRFASLVLGTEKSESLVKRKKKVIRMAVATSILSMTFETTWALGVSVLGGLLLT